MARTKYKDEYKIVRIGGKLEDYYYYFKRDIEHINEYYFMLFCELGFSKDISLILEALRDELKNLCDIFIRNSMNMIEAGNLPKDIFLSQRTITRLASLPPEKREDTWKRETERSLKNMYTSIEERYTEENVPFGLYISYSLKSLDIFGKTLFVTPERIEIDGSLFIESYKSYMDAESSETSRLHKEAAEALNRFFNCVCITQKELSRYFVLDGGFVKINIKSVNSMDYSRLGKRTITKNKLIEDRKAKEEACT